MPPETAFPAGAMIGIVIYMLAAIGSLVCLIMVLIPLFKEKGPGLGILGILCGLFTFIWGWINVKQHNLKKVMLAWTVCMVLFLVGYAIFTIAMMKAIAENPEAFQPPAPAAPEGPEATGY